MFVNDLGLAAFLTVQGFPVTRIDGPRGHRAFHFADDSRIPDECRAYLGGAAVPARLYAEALRTTKNLMHVTDDVSM